MSPTKAEWYRGRAEDFRRKAIIAEDKRRRLHWLEAASRWIRLAREESVLPLQLRFKPTAAVGRDASSAMNQVLNHVGRELPSPPTG